MRAVAVVALVCLAAPAVADDDGGALVRLAPVPERTPVVRTHALPWTPRGHSVKWQTGAILTFASLGVIAIGGGMMYAAWGSRMWPDDWHHLHGDDAVGVSGFVIACDGAGALVFGGPITWLSGVGEGDDRDRVR